MFFVISVWVICAIVAAIVAGKKNRNGAGWFFAALLLTPLMLLIILALPAEPGTEVQLAVRGLRKCPFCAEEVKAEAVVCKHCGKDLPKMQAEPEAENLPKCPSCSSPVGREAFYCRCGAVLR